MKKSAFTLIELLVVIAIIALLAGIALPVFQKAQERGRATNDAANLRQVGLGLQAYLLDNDDQMFAIAGAAGSGGSPVTWPVTMHDKYVTNWKVFHSPFDSRPAVEKAPAPVSYAINTNVFAPSDPSKSSYKGNASQFVSPSELIMMAPNPDKTPKKVSFSDTSLQNPILEQPNPGSKLGTHSNRNQINVLYGDAHVAGLVWGEYSDTASEEGLRRWQPLGALPTQ